VHAVSLEGKKKGKGLNQRCSKKKWIWDQKLIKGHTTNTRILHKKRGEQKISEDPVLQEVGIRANEQEGGKVQMSGIA